MKKCLHLKKTKRPKKPKVEQGMTWREKRELRRTAPRAAPPMSLAAFAAAMMIGK